MATKDKLRAREMMKKCFNKGIKAGEAYEIVREKFGEIISKTIVSFWFRRFRMQNFDLNDKRGRPAAFFDLEEFRRWVQDHPKQTLMELARQFNSSRSNIARKIKALGFVAVDGVWIPQLIEEDGQQNESVTEVVEKELTLEQKIFIVASYYENGRKYDKILDEFEKKFNIGSIESLEDISMTVVQMFESTGSVTDSAYLCIRQKKIIIKEEPADEDLIEVDNQIETKQTTSVTDNLPSVSDSQKTTPLKAYAMISQTASAALKKCEICGKLINPYNFKNHLRIHGDERAFECEICKKTFKTKNYLASHKKVHIPIDQRTVLVCQICGKRSFHKANHNKHVKAHELKSVDNFDLKPPRNWVDFSLNLS